MQQRRPDLLSIIEAVLPAQLPTLPARELANTLWGFAKVNVGGGGMQSSLGEGCTDLYVLKMCTCCYQFVQQPLVAPQIGHCPPPEVLDAAFLGIQRALPDFTAQELFNVAWSLARMRAHPPYVCKIYTIYL